MSDKAKVILVVSLFLLGIGGFIWVHNASVLRWKKSLFSEMHNGVNRTVTVYDYDGKEIKSWSGKFDVTKGETGIMFDGPDGKRVIISGGIVINEEN